MGDLPRCYTVLFNAVTDAIGALEQQNYGLARELLISGQQDAENTYLDEEGTSPDSKAAV